MPVTPQRLVGPSTFSLPLLTGAAYGALLAVGEYSLIGAVPGRPRRADQFSSPREVLKGTEASPTTSPQAGTNEPDHGRRSLQRGPRSHRWLQHSLPRSRDRIACPAHRRRDKAATDPYRRTTSGNASTPIPSSQPEAPEGDPVIRNRERAFIQRVLRPGKDKELEERLGGIRVATLVAFGTEDAIVPREMGRAYKSEDPELQLRSGLRRWPHD